MTENVIKASDGSNCTIKDNIIMGVNPKSTIEDLSKELTSDGNKLITYYGTKLKKDESGNVKADADSLLQFSTKLTGEDVLSTGDIARIGNKTYTIAMCGDVNGDGMLDMTDVALVLTDYRKIENEEPLIGIYKQAGDVDETSEIDMNDVANMLNYYRQLQVSPKTNSN